MLSLMAEHGWYRPGSHFVNLAPGVVTKHMCHPFVGYDKAPAQVGDDDGPARGSGGDDDDGDDFDMSEAALQKVVAAPAPAQVGDDDGPARGSGGDAAKKRKAKERKARHRAGKRAAGDERENERQRERGVPNIRNSGRTTPPAQMP